MKTVYIYTDGSCQGNPGPGGWAAILKNENGSQYKEITGAELHTTNNRMELTPVIESLMLLKKPSRVILTSDSQYVTKAINCRWLENWKKYGWKTANKKKVKNIDLWKQIDELIHKHEVHFIWVKGHSGHTENERCDYLAKNAISKLCNFS